MCLFYKLWSDKTANNNYIPITCAVKLRFLLRSSSVFPQQKATTGHVAVKLMPCNLKQISWFECTVLTAIYKPEAYPLRIPSWEIVFSSCSIYADVVKPPPELGAPEERQMRRGNIHHKTRSQTASRMCATYLSPFDWCVVFFCSRLGNVRSWWYCEHSCYHCWW